MCRGYMCMMMGEWRWSGKKNNFEKYFLNLDILYGFDIIGVSYEVKEKHV